MSEDSTERRRALSVRPTSYEVGYGKPPPGNRFQPGRSGNPRGRPPGAKNRKPAQPALNAEQLKDIILAEAYRSVQVNDPSGPLTIPMAQAVMRSLAVNAAKGHQRSQRLFTELLSNTERDRKELHDRWFDTALTYKIEWDKELERRRKLGITGPEPLPHPDDLVIDMGAATVHIRGPMTREQKANWDYLAEHRDLARSEIANLERRLKRTRSPDTRVEIEDAIAIYRDAEAKMVNGIGEWPGRAGR